jgi:hypothetical protein
MSRKRIHFTREDRLARNARQVKLKRLKNPEFAEQCRDRCRQWRRKNRLSILLYNQASRPPRSPDARLKTRIGNRIRRELKGIDKQAPTMQIVGCSIEFLKQWLESQFRRGMTWDNYGDKWHIDHIIPVSEYDLTDPAQLRQAFNWQNMRPLSAKANMKKGSKIVICQECLPLHFSTVSTVST